MDKGPKKPRTYFYSQEAALLKFVQERQGGDLDTTDLDLINLIWQGSDEPRRVLKHRLKSIVTGARSVLRTADAGALETIKLERGKPRYVFHPKPENTASAPPTNGAAAISESPATIPEATADNPPATITQPVNGPAPRNLMSSYEANIDREFQARLEAARKREDQAKARAAQRLATGIFSFEIARADGTIKNQEIMPDPIKAVANAFDDGSVADTIIGQDTPEENRQAAAQFIIQSVKDNFDHPQDARINQWVQKLKARGITADGICETLKAKYQTNQNQVRV